jgi:hypothetical protein
MEDGGTLGGKDGDIGEAVEEQWRKWLATYGD